MSRIIQLGRALASAAIERMRSYREPSYAQDGEDRILAHLFRETPRGFYVDVGAHHPRRYSNTFLFYERGWRGINIDPVPGTRSRFALARPRDITLECGVADQTGELTYYLFDEAAYNTFNEPSYRMIVERGFPRSLGSKKIAVRPLREILLERLPAGQSIDFLTVDAEGWDLTVLASNDWQRFRPRAVVAEDGVDVESSLDSPIARFLREHGYTFVSRTNQSVIWVDRSRVI